MVSIDVLEHNRKDFECHSDIKIKNICADLFWATKTTDLDEKKQIISGLMFFFSALGILQMAP